MLSMIADQTHVARQCGGRATAGLRLDPHTPMAGPHRAGDNRFEQMTSPPTPSVRARRASIAPPPPFACISDPQARLRLAEPAVGTAARRMAPPFFNSSKAPDICCGPCASDHKFEVRSPPLTPLAGFSSSCCNGDGSPGPSRWLHCATARAEMNATMPCDEAASVASLDSAFHWRRRSSADSCAGRWSRRWVRPPRHHVTQTFFAAASSPSPPPPPNTSGCQPIAITNFWF